jgi:hypothetical protein
MKCNQNCSQGRRCDCAPRIPSYTTTEAALGRHFMDKWISRLHEAGGDYQVVATQMRKQGIPLNVTRTILFGGEQT